jgi:hypothetical protein
MKSKANSLLGIRIPTRVVALLLLAAAGLAMSGCRFYNIVSTSQPDTATVAKAVGSKIFFLHDSVQTWYIKGVTLKNDTLFGEFIKTYSYRQQPLGKSATRGYASSDTIRDPGGERKPVNTRLKGNDRYNMNEVHLYAMQPALSVNGTGSLPLTSIRIAEYYSHDPQTSTCTSMACAAPLVLAGGALLFIAIASCPFIYSYDGTDFRFSGEVYAGAITRQLERDDYLRLDGISPSDGTYRIRIRNELREIQHTNLAEILVVDGPSSVGILADKNGKCHAVADPRAPLSAISAKGGSILDEVSARDGRVFEGDINPETSAIHQEAVITFQRAGAGSRGKLLLRARNTLWMEYVISEFQQKMGMLDSDLSRKLRNRGGEELRKWTLAQNIPLSVFIDRNGSWELVDYFNVIGPVAFKDDVLEVNLEGTGEGPVRIKLVTGNRFWEIDYVALDQSADAPLSVHRVSLASAMSTGSKDLLPDLLGDDDRYYVQPGIGDEAELAFTVPGFSSGARTVILHTKGWYEPVKRNNGMPDLASARSALEPDELPRFAAKLMQKLTASAAQ